MVAHVPGLPSPTTAQREAAERAGSFPRSHEEGLELGQLGSVPVPRHAGEAFLRGRPRGAVTPPGLATAPYISGAGGAAAAERDGDSDVPQPLAHPPHQPWMTSTRQR